MAKRAPRTGTPRTSVLGVRVPPEERQMIEDAAISAGMTVSAFIAATVIQTIDARRRPFGASVNSLREHLDELRSAVNTAPRDAVNSNGRLGAESASVSIVSTTVNKVSLPVNRPAPLLDATGAPVRRLTLPDASRTTVEAPKSISLSDPAAVYELRRIGNNINQLAHAANGLMPPDTRRMIESFHHLFEALGDAPEFKRRIEAIRLRNDFNGAAPPQTRIELPGSLSLRPSRPGQRQ